MSKTTKNQKATEAEAVAIPHVVLTDRYAQAVAYASIIHAIDTRKGTNISYMSHLLGVSSLVIEAGGDEDEAIAGLLHDAVEDAGGLPRLEDVRARFGKKVATIVLACSDSTDEEWKKTVAYWPRKQAYLDHLEKADPRAVLVSIADKVHNARAIVTDLERSGNEVLEKFNGTADEIVQYYAECLRIGKAKYVPDALTIPLGLAVDTIREYVEGVEK
jgi:(p)ppGpp synthase/HD superfamily hydrolase